MPTPTSALRGSLKKKCQGRGWVCAICPAARKGQPFFPTFREALNHERTAHDLEPSADDRNANHAGGTRIPENPLQTTDETCWDKIGHPPLTSEGLRQWEMHAHVDHVYDLVPFWQRGIDAAEKGEVLRLEEFLDKMEGDGGWRTANEVLGMLGEWKASASERARAHDEWGNPYQGGWAAASHRGWEPEPFGWAAASQRGGWGAASTRIPSDATGSSHGGESGWGIRENWSRSDLKKGRPGNGGATQDSCGIRARVKPVRAVRGDNRREEFRHFVDAIAHQEAANDERRRQMHLFFEMPIEQKIQKIQETIRFLRTHA